MLSLFERTIFLTTRIATVIIDSNACPHVCHVTRFFLLLRGRLMLNLGNRISEIAMRTRFVFLKNYANG